MFDDVQKMSYRKKRKLGIWIFGLFFLSFLFYGFRSLQRYFIYVQLKAKLRPLEYVVYLGNFNVESFLHDTSQNVQVPDKLLTDTDGADKEILLGHQLPDTRSTLCKSLLLTRNLPSTSVVIVYKYETKSVLLRTIYSILLRSPPDLLEEIILVDDASNDISTGLEFAKIPKLKVIRNPHFEGLVRSFNLGASHALAPVLTFVSANCEVNIGWLEPLLNRLAHIPNSVAVPKLDRIKSKTLEYEETESTSHIMGGFDWTMAFEWKKTTGGTNLNGVIRTPVYPGHVLSIRKERFISLGKFDPMLEQFGGENFELSFKSWMCGGSVEIVPCSRVGQLNLEAEVSGIPRGSENIYNKNIRRVAEVWMDDYKRFFYHAKPSARMLQIGSVMERRALRSHLKCRSFKWYLDNVYQELSPPVTDELMYGRIQQNNLCIDIEIGHVPAIAKLGKCSADKDTQEWSWKRKGEITNGGMCLSSDAIETHGYVMVHFCTNDNSQKWRYLNGQIYRVGTSQCIDSHKAEVGLVISDCDDLYPSQKWTISSQQADSVNKDEPSPRQVATLAELVSQHAEVTHRAVVALQQDEQERRQQQQPQHRRRRQRRQRSCWVRKVKTNASK